MAPETLRCSTNRVIGLGYRHLITRNYHDQLIAARSTTGAASR